MNISLFWCVLLLWSSILSAIITPCAAQSAFVYAAVNGQIRQMHIGSDYVTAQIASNITPPGTGARILAVNAATHSLYTASSLDASIAQYHIGENGILEPLIPATISIKGGVEQMLCDSSGHFLYTLRPSLAIFRIQTDGTLLEIVQPSNDYVGGMAIAVHPIRPYLYLIKSDSLMTFHRKEDGLVELIQTIPFGPQYQGGLTCDPTGHFLLARGPGTLLTFPIQSDGTIQSSGQERVAWQATTPNDESTPWSIEIPDPKESNSLFPPLMQDDNLWRFQLYPPPQYYFYSLVQDINTDPKTGKTIFWDRPYPLGSGKDYFVYKDSQTIVCAPNGQFVYIADSGRSAHWDRYLNQFRLVEDGTCVPLSPERTWIPREPYALTVHPSGNDVFVGGHNLLAHYAIGKDGTLKLLEPDLGIGDEDCTAIGIFPIVPPVNDLTQTGSTLTESPVLSQPIIAHLPVAPPRWAYSTTQRGIDEFSVGIDGRLSPLSPPYKSIPNSSEYSKEIAIEPRGRFLLRNDILLKTISCYRIEKNGQLTFVNTVAGAVSDAPRTEKPIFDPSGQYVYLLNRSSRMVQQYQLSSEKGLTPLDPPLVCAGQDPYILKLNTRTKTIYAVNTNGILLFFQIQQNGQLVPKFPRGVFINYVGIYPDYDNELALDPSECFAYVPHPQSGSIVRFAVNADGTLKELPILPFAFLEDHSGSFAFDAQGRFAYINSYHLNALIQYKIENEGHIKLMSPPAAPTGAGATALIMDPTGHFIYVVNNQEATISQFRITPDGPLAQIGPDTLDIRMGPVFFDPSRKFLYIGNHSRITNWNDNFNFNTMKYEIVDDHLLSIYHAGPDGVLRFVPGTPMKTAHPINTLVFAP